MRRGGGDGLTRVADGSAATASDDDMARLSVGAARRATVGEGAAVGMSGASLRSTNSTSDTAAFCIEPEGAESEAK